MVSKSINYQNLKNEHLNLEKDLDRLIKRTMRGESKFSPLSYADNNKLYNSSSNSQKNILSNSNNYYIDQSNLKSNHINQTGLSNRNNNIFNNDKTSLSSSLHFKDKIIFPGEEAIKHLGNVNKLVESSIFYDKKDIKNFEPQNEFQNYNKIMNNPANDVKYYNYPKLKTPNNNYNVGNSKNNDHYLFLKNKYANNMDNIFNYNNPYMKISGINKEEIIKDKINANSNNNDYINYNLLSKSNNDNYNKLKLIGNINDITQNKSNNSNNNTTTNSGRISKLDDEASQYQKNINRSNGEDLRYTIF